MQPHERTRQRCRHAWSATYGQPVSSEPPPHAASRHHRPHTRLTTAPPAHPAARLEARGRHGRFSEVVRRARTEGPQRVTVRGKDAVVVIAVETLEKLLPPAKPRQSLIAFLQDLGIGDLDLTRDRGTGRDINL